MSASTRTHEAAQPAVSLSARKIEQLAARLCALQPRGTTRYCTAHGNVVAEDALVCGHVRPVLEQIVALVEEAHTLRAAPTTGLHEPGAEVRFDVSA